MEQDENVFTRVNTEPEARILDYAIQSPQLIGSLGTPILSSGYRPDSLRQAFICPQDIVH